MADDKVVWTTPRLALGGFCTQEVESVLRRFPGRVEAAEVPLGFRLAFTDGRRCFSIEVDRTCAGYAGFDYVLAMVNIALTRWRAATGRSAETYGV
jgi:hypothetical protein